MSRAGGQPIQATILPELEHLLVRAARHRATPRLGRRRWALAAAVASLLVAAGGAAATGVFELASGETSGGTFSVESKVVPAAGGNTRDGSVCLQLTFSGRGAAHGCGERPTAAKPFGLVIADPLDNGDERVVYGLVTSAISRVEVLGGRGSEVEAVTREHGELPGRFFAVVVPSEGQIELVGYGTGGKEVARLGSLEPPTDPPLSRAEAIRQGDPAGFAPAVASPETFVYKGEPIDPGVAAKLGLACMQGSTGVRCYDSVGEAEAVQGR